MEKGDFRREKLAELGLDRLQRRPDTGWSAFAHRLHHRWFRFMASAGWEKAFFALACLVAGIVAVIGIVALATRGGNNDGSGPAASLPRATATPASGVRPTATALVINVPVIPTRLPTSTPVAGSSSDEPNREDCDAIRGTPYESDAERNWFIENCGGSAKASPTRPPGSPGPTSPPPPTQPPPPTAPQGVSAGEAISLGAGWMTTSAPKSYTVDSGTCSAVRLSDHWIVSCTGRLSGCQSDACDQPLQVCVFADRRVVPAASC